jgi:HPt (histidine-containing phosphotransfer) domain-containing protein
LAIESSEERELNPSAGVAEIRELCLEFQRAIAALTSNDVAAVETSTAVQETLVDKLQDWFRTQKQDQETAIRVSASDVRALINLTRVYSSLLQRALRTTRLRASLCQTYRQNFPSASEPAAATGWSCEA